MIKAYSETLAVATTFAACGRSYVRHRSANRHFYCDKAGCEGIRGELPYLQPKEEKDKHRRPQQGRTRNTAEENQVACRCSCTTWQPKHAEKEKSFATQRKDHNERNNLDAEDDEREGAHKTRTGAAARRHARSATSHREHYQGGG